MTATSCVFNLNKAAHCAQWLVIAVKHVAGVQYSVSYVQNLKMCQDSEVLCNFIASDFPQPGPMLVGKFTSSGKDIKIQHWA